MNHASMPTQRVAGESNSVRVLVVDDNADIRQLMRITLQFDDRLQVCAEAVDGPSGIEAWLAQRPDVVVMDLNMPGMSGLAAAELMLSHAPWQPIILFSAAFSLATQAEADALGVALCCDKRDLGNLPALVRHAATKRLTLVPQPE